MPKKPFISIVSVTLDNLPGLRRTDNSLMMQSFRDFEWIVIDGGSMDGTIGHLSTSRANWTSEPDQGIYDAMNKGLSRAAGDYVLFLNAGDALAGVHLLERLEHFIKASGTAPDFIYGDSLENNAYKLAGSIEKPWRMFTHHQSMLYRRSALQDLRYNTKYKIAADYDLTMRALKQAKNILYFPFPICIFETGGVSQKNALRGRNEQFLVRHRQRIANPVKNISIYLLQVLAWIARRVTPGLYWRMKSSGNNAPGFAQT